MKLSPNQGQTVPISLLKKVFNIMKVTVVLCLLTTFCTFASVSYSQTAEISLNLQGVTLQEALDAVKKQSDFSFWYRNEEIDLFKKVSVKIDHKNIREVMTQLLYGQDLAYTIDEKHIIIYKKDKSAEPQRQVQKQKRITGIVTDPNGNPIIGANVVEKGTTNGTITDLDGKFSLTVDDRSSLLVSYIGFLSQELQIKGESYIKISLEESNKQLDEVVVIGYGTVKKSDLTGSVASVKSSAIMDLPTNNISQALQGRIPGVQIQQNSGAPGANMQIRIRGANSISGNNEPLWIINGFPGDQSMINSSDIESVEVLKDASATAIYGSGFTSVPSLINTSTFMVGSKRLKISLATSMPANTPASLISNFDFPIAVAGIHERVV